MKLLTRLFRHFLHFHWQDLNDNRRYWLHGHCWLNLRSDDSRFVGRGLHMEWCFPERRSAKWSITFGGGDSDRDLSFAFTVPFLCTIYLTLERFFSKSPIRLRNFDRGSDREISIRIFDWAIWYHFWVGSMASWSRDYPWCKWWRQGSFHILDFLLGRTRYSSEVLRKGIPVTIPMPEGVYSGAAKVTHDCWKRPRWPIPLHRTYTYIDVPGGIPHSGKGENSWDCGDDGVFGCGVEGDDLDKAVAHYREVVMKNRQKYGQPSPGAIIQALTPTTAS